MCERDTEVDELEGAACAEEKHAKQFDAIQKAENAGFQAEDIVITFLFWGIFMVSLFSTWFNSLNNEWKLRVLWITALPMG